MYFGEIREWSKQRGLDKQVWTKQTIKLVEEFGELCQALLKEDEDKIVDSIGDMIVVLTILAQQHDYDVEYCIQQAYEEIKNRTGKTVDGVFVKD